jgi:uncharacterized metal-binding protein YceD (DUF177 family)
MNKVIIKDISSFCENREHLKGVLSISSMDIQEIINSDPRIKIQDIQVFYDFKGKKNFQQECFLDGRWQCSIELNCCTCLNSFFYNIQRQYHPLRLLNEEDNITEYMEDSFECSFRYVDFAQWLFSEVMLEIPVSPKHDGCSLQPEILSHFQEVFSE